VGKQVANNIFVVFIPPPSAISQQKTNKKRRRRKRRRFSLSNNFENPIKTTTPRNKNSAIWWKNHLWIERI